MRIRTLKPEFWANETLAALSAETRLLAIALLNYADDEGFFVATPALVRGALFPFSDNSLSVQRGLSELSSVGFIRVGNDHEGRSVGQVVNFVKHQKVNRPNKSKIKHLCKFSDDSLNAHGAVTDGIGTGNREEEGEKEEDPPLPPDCEPSASTEDEGEGVSQEEAEARHHREYCRKEAKGLPSAFLADAAFRDAWCDWIAHLKARHHKGFNPPFTTVTRHKEQIRAHSVADATWALTEGIRRNLAFPADPAKRPAASATAGEYVDYQSREATPEQHAAALDVVLRNLQPLPTLPR